MPTGTLRVVHSLSLNPFLPIDHESPKGWVLIDLGPIPVSPEPSRLQGALQILNKCFPPPPGSGGPKQPMRCGRWLGNLGVSQGKEGCLFFELFLHTLPILALFWYSSKLDQTEECFSPCFLTPPPLSDPVCAFLSLCTCVSLITTSCPRVTLMF